MEYLFLLLSFYEIVWIIAHLDMTMMKILILFVNQMMEITIIVGFVALIQPMNPIMIHVQIIIMEVITMEVITVEMVRTLVCCEYMCKRKMDEQFFCC